MKPTIWACTLTWLSFPLPLVWERTMSVSKVSHSVCVNGRRGWDAPLNDHIGEHFISCYCDAPYRTLLFFPIGYQLILPSDLLMHCQRQHYYYKHWNGITMLIGIVFITYNRNGVGTNLMLFHCIDIVWHNWIIRRYRYCNYYQL